MQLALDDRNDLILATQDPVEGIGDPEFDLPMVSSFSYEQWADFSLGAYTSSGQLIMPSDSVAAIWHSDIVLGDKVNLSIEIESGCSFANQLRLNSSSLTYQITSNGVHEFEFVVVDDTDFNFGILNQNSSGDDIVINYHRAPVTKGAGVYRVTDGRYTIQLVKNRLMTGLGEWLLDPRLGWMSLINYEKNPDLFLIELRAKRVILTTPNVKSIEEFDMVLHDRILTVTFKATTTFGVIDLTVPWGAT